MAVPDARRAGEVVDAVSSGERLRELLTEETERFERENPLSKAAFERGKKHLVGGVPMPWMTLWPGSSPLTVATARGARLTDIDGHEYVDFCLGDTGAMTGHSPDAVVRAATKQLEIGTTTMLPTENAAVVGDELAKRFGLQRWLLTLSATDANRTALRLARHATGRPLTLVYSYCYHGSVDEALAIRDEHGATVTRLGNVGPPVDIAQTTRAIEFNDVDALEAALAPGDVAIVLAEPAMTNIGIVLPDPGYHEALRELTRKYGSLLLIDETHTLSTGPGGATAAWDLEPDLLTVGKAIAGGIPGAALGMTAELADRLLDDPTADLEDTGGIGGTLAGNGLTLAAMRAALTEVLTDAAFARAEAVADSLYAGISATIAAHDLPWTVQQLGSRVEYRFARHAPRNGSESAAVFDPLLEQFMHLFALNRGVLITPFHNMLLTCGESTMADAELHGEVFEAAVVALRS